MQHYLFIIASNENNVTVHGWMDASNFLKVELPQQGDFLPVLNAKAAKKKVPLPSGLSLSSHLS